MIIFYRNDRVIARGVYTFLNFLRAPSGGGQECVKGEKITNPKLQTNSNIQTKDPGSWELQHAFASNRKD
jgi:hypothetical protein